MSESQALVFKPHTCHAVRCNARVQPTFLMCGPHWSRVSPTTRSAVWRAYRPGQCDDKRPSAAWMVAATKAIIEVAWKEHPEAVGGLTEQLNFWKERLADA